MLGSISFRAFFRFAGFDVEKGHGAPCPFFVWKRIGQEQNDFTTVAPKRLLQLSAAGEVFCTLCRACPQISYHKNGEKLASPERGDSPRGGEMPLSGEPNSSQTLCDLKLADTAQPVPTRLHLANCAQLDQPYGETVLKLFRCCTILFAICSYFPLQFMHFI